MQVKDQGSGNLIIYELRAPAGGPYQCSRLIPGSPAELVDDPECPQSTEDGVTSQINVSQLGPGPWDPLFLAIRMSTARPLPMTGSSGACLLNRPEATAGPLPGLGCGLPLQSIGLLSKIRSRESSQIT